MRIQKPKIAIMILNYNGQNILLDCVSSIEKTTYTEFEVFVIDNGSTDDSIACLSRNFPWVKVVQFEKNYGFCQAYNKAARIIDAEYFLFLNNDIAISNKDWLSEMVKTMSSEPRIGAVGSKLVMFDNTSIIENVGGTIYKWQGGVRIGFEEKDRGQYDKTPVNPFYVSGASLLIKKNLFMQAGGFDSEMFAYSEDLDLCWRLRLMGYKIQSCPRAILIHRLSASWKKSMKSLYLAHRNFLRASLKNYSAKNLLKHIPPFIMTSLFFGLFASLLSKNGAFLLSVTKSLLHNILKFNSTLKARQIVQNTRNVSDNVVLEDLPVQGFERMTKIAEKSKSFM
jgi:GT2 family glycosyltransferase